MVAVVIIILILICYLLKNRKKTKKEELLLRERLKDQKLFDRGYIKLFTDLYINENEKKILANNREYKFSQILDCTLQEDGTETLNTYYSAMNGNFKNINKFNSNTYGLGSAIGYIEAMYINIIVDDIENPNIIINLGQKGILLNSKKYKELKAQSEKIISTFKVIISRNN